MENWGQRAILLESKKEVPDGMTFNKHAALDGLPYKRANSRSFNLFRLIVIASSGAFIMFTFLLLFLSGFATVDGIAVERQASSATLTSTSSVLQYFQTTPELYAGMSLGSGWMIIF